jgi:CubicO group peptidase (beta-lactamase class C family)
LSGTKLVYARGYTDAEPGYPTVDATSSFRMASLTKVITGIEIMRMVERGHLSLDATIASLIDLGLPTITPADARFRGITVREALSHTFRSAWIGSTPQCLVRDLSDDAYAAQAIGGALPLNDDQALRATLTGVERPVFYTPAQNPDGSWQTCYSNVGYVLLGKVIEANSGPGTYFGKVQNDIFAPLGLTRPHVAIAPFASQPQGEALYRESTPSILASAIEPGAPLEPAAYGGVNFIDSAAAGGLSMSVVDYARVMAMLDVDTHNPVLLAPATTVSAMIAGPFGFEGSLGPTVGYKGGELWGLQSSVVFRQGGYTYVLAWAADGLDAIAQGDADQWFPSWSALDAQIGSVLERTTTDLFPSYGMTSL